MAIKLIALDLDGTVLNEEKKITEPVAEALKYAAGRGVYIVPVTGRPYGGIPRELMDMDCVDYAVSSNGASAWRGDTKIISHPVPAQLCRELLEKLRGMYIMEELFMDGAGYVSPESYKKAEQLHAGTAFWEYYKKSRRVDPELERRLLEREDLEELALRCLGAEEGDAVAELLGAYPQLKAARPTPFYTEIVSVQAGKGRTLEELGSLLGLGLEEIMAVGDSDNDREMLMKAGVPVAMGNAGEELKKLARYVTADNEHDGVAQAIYKFIP